MITKQTLNYMENKIRVAKITGEEALAEVLTLEYKRLEKIHAIHENKRKKTLNNLIQKLEQPEMFLESFEAACAKPEEDIPLEDVFPFVFPDHLGQ